MPPARKPSAARERLLATASELFNAEGINNVGVSRIVAASQVTLATFYRHFPGGLLWSIGIETLPTTDDV